MIQTQEQVIKTVNQIRCKLMIQEPFLGHIMCKMKFVPMPNHPKVPTACTDGVTTYYNPEFFGKHTREEVAFIMLHEVGHCMMKHLWRVGRRDPKLWNIACDYAMNLWIEDYGKQMQKSSRSLQLRMPKDGLIDRRFEGKTAEQIYATLKQEQQQQQQNPQGKGQSNECGDSETADSGGVQPDDSDGTGDSDQEKDGAKERSDAPQESDGDQVDDAEADPENPVEEGGKGDAGSDGDRFDEEVNDSDPSGGMGDFIPKPLEAEDGGRESAQEAALAKSWEEATVTASLVSRMAGRGSIAGDRAMAVATARDVDWRDILLDMIQRAKDDFSWMKPNRRYSSSGFIIPSLYSERYGKLVIGVDTSGSIDEKTLGEFQSVIRMIVDAVNPEEVLVIYCDDAINREQRFGYDEPVELKPCGGGGTDFRPVFDRVNDEDDVLALIYLTDLFGVFPKEAPSYRTIWAATEGYVTPTFGEVVNIR
jgi:predicted metal-dependent peptidase